MIAVFGLFVALLLTPWVRALEPTPSPFLDATLPFTVIGHRGSSGLYPEHTQLAYTKAIEEGADFIECDICVSKDLKLVCRHEPLLDDTTNVAENPEFADRRSTRILDGRATTGFYTIDFTWDELQTLRAVQRLPFRNQSYNDRYLILSFDQYLDIILAAPRVVGAIPEIKHPDFFNLFIGNRGPRIEDMVLEAFRTKGFDPTNGIGSEGWQRRPAVIQSFETQALEYLASKSALPRLLLMPVVNVTHPEAARAFETIDGLRRASAFADIIGPDKSKLISYNPTDRSRTSTGLVERARSAGLRVQLYTLRNEPKYFEYGRFSSVFEELQYFLDLGVTGGFTDFPATTYDYVRNLRVSVLSLADDVNHQQDGPGGQGNQNYYGTITAF